MLASESNVTSAAKAGRAVGGMRMQRLLATYGYLLHALGALSAIGMLAIPVVVSVDVFSRHFGGGNVIWVADVCEYLLFATTLIGAPWLLHLGRHVRIDVLPSLLTGQASQRLEQAINLLILVVCLILISHAIGALGQALKYQTMFYKALVVPVWPFIALFIASFALMCVELTVRIFARRIELDDVQIGL